MQQSNEPSIEHLVDTMMTEISTEKIAADFTANLMMRVKALPPMKSITYEPIISKKGWVFILLGMLALIAMILNNANNTKTDWINLDGMNHFLLNASQNFKLFQFSTISIYAVILTTILFFVQINVLVNQYQKSLTAHST